MFALQIGIPEDEVFGPLVRSIVAGAQQLPVGRIVAADRRGFLLAAGGIRAADLPAAVTRIDVARIAVVNVVARFVKLPDHFAGLCVGAGEAAFCPAGCLIDGDDFQPRIAVGDVGHVDVIRMAVPGGPERLAVVIEYRAAEDDFIAAVSVNINRPGGVCPLTPVFAAVIAAVVLPQRFEFAVLELPRFGEHQAVGAAQRDDAGGFAVQIADCELVARISAVVVGHVHERFPRGPRRAGNFSAGHAVEYHHVLFAGHHLALVLALFLAQVAGFRICCFQNHFCLAVAVYVIDDVGTVPDAALDVPAEILCPENGPVAFDCLQHEGML